MVWERDYMCTCVQNQKNSVLHNGQQCCKQSRSQTASSQTSCRHKNNKQEKWTWQESSGITAGLACNLLLPRQDTRHQTNGITYTRYHVSKEIQGNPFWIACVVRGRVVQLVKGDLLVSKSFVQKVQVCHARHSQPICTQTNDPLLLLNKGVTSIMCIL